MELRPNATIPLAPNLPSPGYHPDNRIVVMGPWADGFGFGLRMLELGSALVLSGEKLRGGG